MKKSYLVVLSEVFLLTTQTQARAAACIPPGPHAPMRITAPGVYESCRIQEYIASKNGDPFAEGDRSLLVQVRGGQDGIVVEANGVTLRGFEVSGQDRNGIWQESGKNLLVEHNVIHDVARKLDSRGHRAQGILAGAEPSIIQYNVIYDIDYTNNVGPHAIYVANAGGAQIRYNHIFRVSGSMIQFNPEDRSDGTSTGNVIENNWIHDGKGNSTGLGLFGFTRSLIANNVIYGTEKAALTFWDEGGLVVKPSNNRIYHNTFLAGRNGRNIYLSASGSGNVYENNIFLGGSIDGIRGNNLLSGSASSLFVNASSGDYHLKATATSAIDAGNPLAEIKTDLDGTPRPQGRGPDLGAFEYRGENPEPTTPSAPGGFAATAGDSRIDLRWNPNPSGENVEGYHLFSRRSGETDFSRLTASPTSQTRFEHLGLTNGATYSYQLTAVGSTGSESRPSSLSATPGVVPVAKLHALTAPRRLQNGQNGTCVVRLDRAAPLEGVQVQLSIDQQNDPVIVGMPASVKIPEGQLQASFTIRARSKKRDKTATITARAAGLSKQVTVTAVGKD